MIIIIIIITPSNIAPYILQYNCNYNVSDYYSLNLFLKSLFKHPWKKIFLNHVLFDAKFCEVPIGKPLKQWSVLSSSSVLSFIQMVKIINQKIYSQVFMSLTILKKNWHFFSYMGAWAWDFCVIISYSLLSTINSNNNIGLHVNGYLKCVFFLGLIYQDFLFLLFQAGFFGGRHIRGNWINLENRFKFPPGEILNLVQKSISMYKF